MSLSFPCTSYAAFDSEAYHAPQHSTTLAAAHALSASANLVWTHDSHAERVAFFGRALGCPPLSSMLRALRQQWITNCPIVTCAMLRKHHENPVATALGYLELQRQHSSQPRPPKPIAQPGPPTPPTTTDDIDLDSMLDDLSIHHDLTNTLLVTYIEVKKSTMSTDAVGDYPIVSSQGHTGFLVASLNGVAHMELMTGHSGAAHLAATTAALLFYTDQKKNVKRIMTDAETSDVVQQYYRDQNVDLQIANADMHRQLFAELKIKFGKRHFISTRASLDTRYPDNEWHRWVEHVELCLQILHPCTDDHTKSGYMWLYGKPFDWDRYPLAPPATMVVAFTSRDHRDSWDDHGWVGWYMGPDLDHYRGFRVWNPSTNAYSTVGTVAWFPQHVKMPGFYTHQKVLTLLSDVVTELRRSHLATPEATANVQQLSMALENIKDMYATPDLQPAVPAVHPSLPQAIEDAQTAYDMLQRVRPAGIEYNAFHPLKAPRAPRTATEAKQEKQARALATKAAKMDRQAKALQHLRLEVQLQQQQAAVLLLQPPPLPVVEAEPPPVVQAPAPVSAAPPKQPRRRTTTATNPPPAPTTRLVQPKRHDAKPPQSVAINNPRLSPHRTRQATKPRDVAVHSVAVPMPPISNLDRGNHSDDDMPAMIGDDDSDSDSDDDTGDNHPLVLQPSRPRTVTTPQHTMPTSITPAFYTPLAQPEQRVSSPEQRVSTSPAAHSSSYSWPPPKTPGAHGHASQLRKTQHQYNRLAQPGTIPDAPYAPFSPDDHEAQWAQTCAGFRKAKKPQYSSVATIAVCAVTAGLIHHALPLVPDQPSINLAMLSASELAEIHAITIAMMDEARSEDKASRTTSYPHYPTAEVHAVARAAVHAVALNLTPTGKPLTWNSAQKGPNKDEWHQSDINEFHKQLRDRGVLSPVHFHDIPADRVKDITGYIKAVREKQPVDGDVSRRVRGTADGRFVHYPGATAAKTAEMAAVKILLQSVVSDGAKWMSLDLTDFYIMHDLERKEYVRIRLSEIPPEIMDEYDLHQYVHHGCVIFQVNKALFGLPQAGLISQQQLEVRLAAAGYVQCKHTPCVFRHVSNGVTFALVVDDFGVKYTDTAGAQHLIDTLRAIYDVKVDWTGSKFLGFTIHFDDARTQVVLSLPGYIAKVLQRFGVPTVKAYSPAIYVRPDFHQPDLVMPNTAPALTPPERTRLQEIVGVLLYYARAVDCSILPALSALASEQATPTEQLWPAVNRLLAYVATYPDNKLVLTACDMILHSQSDASYLTRSHARSVVGGYHFLGDVNEPTRTNGAILAVCSIIPVVVGSAAEAEYAGVFVNGQEAFHLRNILSDMGYPQPPTTIFCDNKCAVGLANDSVKEKRSKAIDMRWHWIRDRIRQQQFNVVWRCGANNLADFFTKPLSVQDHLSILPLLVSTARAIFGLRRAKKRDTFLA